MIDQNDRSKNSKRKQLVKLIYRVNLLSGRSLSRRDFLKMAVTTLSASIAAPLISSCDNKPDLPPKPTDTPEPPPQAIINTPEIILLAHPGAYDDTVKYNNKEVKVVKDEVVVVLARDQTDKWYKVKTKDDHQGWIQQSRTRIAPAFEASVRAVPFVAERPEAAPTSPPVQEPPSVSHYWYPN